MKTVLVVSFFTLTLSCSGGSSPTPGPSGSDFDGIVWTSGGNLGYPLQADSEPIIAQNGEEAQWFDVSFQGIWKLSREGMLTGTDLNGMNDRGPFDLSPMTGGAGLIELVDDEAWIGYDSQSIVVFDLETETQTPIGMTADFQDMQDDDSHMYVLVRIPFVLQKYTISGKTMELEVPLGEDPADPTGPRGEFSGRGPLAVGADFVWVWDTLPNKVHKIEKSDLTVVDTIDISALIDPDWDFIPAQLLAGDEKIYAINRDTGSDNGDFIAIDKATLDAEVIYTTAESLLSDVGINGDLLAYDEGVELHIVNGLTGEVEGNFPNFTLGGEPTIWISDEIVRTSIVW